jgi:hypothetical protein
MAASLAAPSEPGRAEHVNRALQANYEAEKQSPDRLHHHGDGGPSV